jgi:hypothetical protein
MFYEVAVTMLPTLHVCQAEDVLERVLLIQCYLMEARAIPFHTSKRGHSI